MRKVNRLLAPLFLAQNWEEWGMETILNLMITILDFYLTEKE